MERIVFVWESFGVYGYLVVAEVVLLVVLGVQWVRRCLVVSRPEKGDGSAENEGVSVIITSHNRAEQLRRNLPRFLDQDYPDYEVIVVDECSEDETEDVLKELQRDYPRLRCTRIYPDTKFRFTKKLAINIGVLAAKHDILLFSEASCRPLTREWVSRMRAGFDGNTAVVMGLVGDEPSGGRSNFFKVFRMWHFLDMLSAGKRGCLLGNGCNLAYRKKFYLENRGFVKNSQSYLGYDSDIARDLSRFGESRVIHDGAAAVIEERAEHRMERINEMLYHYACKLEFPLGKRLYMDWHSIVRLFFYGGGIFLAIQGVYPLYVMALLLVMLIVEGVALSACVKCLRQERLLLASLLVAVSGFIFHWGMNLYVLFNRSKWK